LPVAPGKSRVCFAHPACPLVGDGPDESGGKKYKDDKTLIPQFFGAGFCFLPPPDQLILKEETVKVTISLNKSSVDLFKKVAKENKTQYQKMIRKLIDFYASQFHP